MRHLDNRDNGLDILQLAYMDHTMGIVIILPRVKTNPLWATKSWRPTNLLAATPLIGSHNAECPCPEAFLNIISQGIFQKNEVNNWPSMTKLRKTSPVKNRRIFNSPGDNEALETLAYLGP